MHIVVSFVTVNVLLLLTGLLIATESSGMPHIPQTVGIDTGWVLTGIIAIIVAMAGAIKFLWSHQASELKQATTALKAALESRIATLETITNDMRTYERTTLATIAKSAHNREAQLAVIVAALTDTATAEIIIDGTQLSDVDTSVIASVQTPRSRTKTDPNLKPTKSHSSR